MKGEGLMEDVSLLIGMNIFAKPNDDKKLSKKIK